MSVHRSIPAYVPVMAAAPVLMMYAANLFRVPFSHFIITLLVFVAAVLALRILVMQTCRRHPATDPLIAIGLGLIFSRNFMNHSFVMELGFIAFLVCIAFFVVTGRVSEEYVTKLVYGVLFVALAPALSTFVQSTPSLIERSALKQDFAASFPDIPVPVEVEKTSKPNRDIYYLIFDRYARGDQLKRVYNFDNTPFLNALRDRGFAVAEKAFSNYQRTAHSLVSSLNLDYLKGVERNDETASHDWVPLYERIEDFRLQRFLQHVGYKFNFLGSWWEPTRNNQFANTSRNMAAWPALGRAIFETNRTSDVVRTMGMQFLDQRFLQCKRAILKFDVIARQRTQGSKPKFTFAHFLVPHPPYVIDADGQCMTVEMAKRRTRRENYIGQIKFANTRILKLVDELQARPGQKPIIIIQADEGPWPEKFAKDEILRLGQDTTPVEWHTVAANDLQEKMGILSAMYLPGIDRSKVLVDATPVNTFRLVLREYFGAPTPSLPDRNYVFHNNSNIYRFHDVTQALGGITDPDH